MSSVPIPVDEAEEGPGSSASKHQPVRVRFDIFLWQKLSSELADWPQGCRRAKAVMI
jgi:hypothetical protein